MRNKSKKDSKIIKRIILIFTAIFFTIYSFLLVQIISSEGSYMPVKSDAIVILGHSIDGDDPSEWLTKRLEQGYKLYKDGYGKAIIVTGGEGPEDNMAVAYAMETWLLAKGMPREDVLVENKAHNTYENFKNSKQIADENNIESIVVVTNDFHIYRSMIIADDFFENVSGKDAEVDIGIRKILAYLKEPLSIIKYEVINVLIS